jgi:hypothetical protein
VSIDGLAMFEPVPAFFTRRLKSLELFVQGCDTALAGMPQARKIVCSRYTARMPLLPHATVKAFRDGMASYATAVREALDPA